MIDEVFKRRVRKIMKQREGKRNYAPLYKGIKAEKLSEREMFIIAIEITIKFLKCQREIIEEGNL